jgi:hypothetical protein
MPSFIRCHHPRQALRHSQLAPCSFQYTSSTPPGFTTENFSTTETETQTNRINPRPLSFNCHCRSVGVERAPRTLPTRCVPQSSPIRPSACPSFRPRPARATLPPQPAPELCGSRRYSEGLGLSVVGGATPGRDTGKRSEVVRSGQVRFIKRPGGP